MAQEPVTGAYRDGRRGPRPALSAQQTALGRVRVLVGYSQKDMARLTGIPLMTYARIERGVLDNPPVRHLANCAMVLGVELDTVMEPEWRTWTVLSPAAPEPPPPPRKPKA